MKRLLLLAWSAAVAGCAYGGYLQEPDLRPLPARSAITQGGHELEARDGDLFFRGGPADIGGALGAELVEEEGAVVVAALLRAETPLRPGDRIVAAAAVVPPRRSAAAPEGAAEQGEQPAPVPPPAGIAALLALPWGQAVRRLDDLRGYRAGLGWVALDLGIRREGAELVARLRLEDEWRRLPVMRWDPDQVFRRAGIELCALDDWPEAMLPLYAGGEHHLVLRVERDAPAAHAGLRPLDAIVDARRFAATGKAVKVSPDGSRSEIAVPPRRRTDFRIPLAVSIEEDGVRSHLGLGPFDWLFHRSSIRSYDPDGDTFHLKTRWSLFSVLQGVSSRREGGEERYFALDPLIDFARLSYWFEKQDEDRREERAARWGKESAIEDFAGAR
jgi:hypothetical protein